MNLNLTRDEASCLKGYAILCIVLHNLLHWVKPLVKENEFYYNYNYRSYWMWNHITEGHPNLIGDILSFFGWYGVPVFIFLSGYGITKKYESARRTTAECSWAGFTGYNFKKLWLLMAPAFVVYLLLSIFVFDKSFAFSTLLAQFTMTINFMCSPNSIDPGVYWYFGLTMQLYLAYRLFLFRKAGGMFWGTCLVLMALSLGISWLLQPDQMERVQPSYEYFSHNGIRWIPVFVLGVMTARAGKDGKDTLWPWICVGAVSAILLFAGSFHQRLWLLTPMFAVGVFWSFVKLVSQVRVLRAVGIWLGGLSAWLFAAHPLVRPFFKDRILLYGQLELDAHSWMWVACYLLVAIAVAWGYRWFSSQYLVSFCERIINRCLKSVSFKKK